MASTHAARAGWPRFCAIVPAAGIGSRMGAGSKKPYLLLAGEPVLFHTLRRIKQARGCAEIVVVLHPDEFHSLSARSRKQMEQQFGVTKLAQGGPARQDSVWAGLQLTDPGLDIVLIHDAVRPLVDPAVVEEVAAKAAKTGAALAAIPATATVKEADAGDTVRRTLPRNLIWLAQTPQGFRRAVILEAYRRARQDGFRGTDDSELVERLGGEVSIVPDSPHNMKITTPHDLLLAEALLNSTR